MNVNSIILQEGTDLTAILGITKWSPNIPSQLMGIMRGNFPTNIISKTDEERIQNAHGVIEEFAGKEVYGSLKIDGTSATYFKLNNELRVCSRNIEFKLEGNEDNLYVKIAKELDLITRILEGYGIQAELGGPGVQGNKMGLEKVTLFVFNVFNIAERHYLDYKDLLEFCANAGLVTVPIIYNGPFKWNTVGELLDYANELNYANNTPAEGVVIRPITETLSPTLKGRLSIKAVSNQFLLKYNE